jgi:mRNA interferase RelE/StbE
VTQDPYELVLTPPARRSVADVLPDVLPEAVAVAVIDFVTTALLDNPRRVGKPLRDDMAGVWAARRGTYRVLCRIKDDLREVVALGVDHRRGTGPPDQGVDRLI